MIEKTILDHLAARLDVLVCMEIPADPPESFVVLEKTGGGRTNRLHTATVAVQSCAASLFGAAQLNEQVKQAMDALHQADEIGRVRLNTDYNYTDTASKRYRYQAVFDLVYY